MSAFCDIAAWQRNPRHRWVYDRLLVACTQSYAAGPAGVEPPSYPVIVKPITNLYGMGRGAWIAFEPTEIPAGHMWAEFLTGSHASIDMHIVGGEIITASEALGFKECAPSLRFAFWAFMGAIEPPDALRQWVRAYLSDYTGPANIETIGGAIIEVHLRLTADWDGVRAPAIGVPLWQSCDLTGLPDWVRLTGQDETPLRHGFAVVSA